MTDIQIKTVVSNSKWIDKVLLSGTIACFIIVLAKIFGGEEIKIPLIDFDINLKYAWFVVVLMSIGHLYTTILFVKSARYLWRESNISDCKKAYDEIISEGGIFFRDFKPRLVVEKKRLARMAINDLSTWVSHISAILILAAILPFNFQNIISNWWIIILGLFLTILNWLIGSQWAITLSELAVEKEKARLLSLKNK